VAPAAARAARAIRVFFIEKCSKVKRMGPVAAVLPGRPPVMHWGLGSIAPESGAARRVWARFFVQVWCGCNS